jgi:hypothetical protein
MPVINKKTSQLTLLQCVDLKIENWNLHNHDPDIQKPQNHSIKKIVISRKSKFKNSYKNHRIVPEFVSVAHSSWISSIFPNFNSNLRFFPYKCILLSSFFLKFMTLFNNIIWNIQNGPYWQAMYQINNSLLHKIV